MSMRRGLTRSFLITTWDGIPIYADWSLPLSAFFVASVAGFSASSWLGYLLTVLVHELGHAALIRRYRLRPTLIYFHGLGGECHYEGDPTRHQVNVIAWGGVIGQALLFATVFVLIQGGNLPEVVVRSGFVSATLGSNALMAALNLLPLRGLDGEHAWGIFRDQRRPKRATSQLSPEQIADELVRKAVEDARQADREGEPRE